MSIRLNEIAPDFKAETTKGTINFHEWLGDVGEFCFLIPKISLLSAPLNWAIWQNLNLSLQKEIARSSV
jgi:hypothetical protein